jgi:hypothetical protein
VKNERKLNENKVLEEKLDEKKDNRKRERRNRRRSINRMQTEDQMKKMRTRTTEVNVWCRDCIISHVSSCSLQGYDVLLM